MSERYGEGSAWWRANQNDPEALAKALKFNEESLLYVAAELKVRAQEAEMAGRLEPALFAAAADKYREYLDKFPISDNFYENQLQLADALFKGQRLAESATEWESLVKTAKSHDYDGLAAVMAFRTWDQLLREQVGPPEKAYAGAQVERTYTSVGGVEMKVMALEDVQKRFIASADRLLQMDLGPESAGFDAASYVDSERVKIMYLPAQVLYYAGRYDEARPRLEAIIREHASEDEAAWAANLLLNTYINEQDNPQIRVWSREFANRKLGASADVTATSALRFQDTLERATFDAAYQAAQRGDLTVASAGYLSFIEEFPKSANRPIAMLNAADTLERSGKADDANGVYERFIKEYPTRDEARPIFFAIASNYESIFELDKAIKIYQELLDRFPNYERAPDAAYMVAFLKEGTGDKLGAAQGYEKYGRTYTSASDREEVFFRAGRLYEAVDRDRAITFYKSYLSQFALTQVDHAIEAQARIADLHKAAGRAKDASSALDELVALFDRAVASGKTPSLASQDRVAEAAFRALQAHHDKIVANKLSRDDKKDGDLLNVKLPAELDAFAAEVQAFSTKYASFWGITGAYYLYGAAEMHYARLGLALEPPAGLSEEDRDVFWQLLEEQLFPKYREREANAVKSWQSVLELATRFHRHSVWIDRSNEALNQFDPKQFPAGKRTLPGDMQTVTPVSLPSVPANAAPGAKPAGGE
jgi:TolA-binding protein